MAMTLCVIILFWQRSAIRSVVHDVERYLNNNGQALLSWSEDTITLNTASEKFLFDVKVVGGIIHSGDLGSTFGVLRKEKSSLAYNVVQAGEEGVSYTSLVGLTWGVVSPAKQYLKIAIPLIKDREKVGAVGVLVLLEPLYAKLRHDLHLIIVYLLVNLIVLTTIGLFRFVSFTVRPVEDLIRLADSYEDEGLPFLSLERKSEYSLLSGSLNQMLQRIENDKLQLQRTIASLEEANDELRSKRREVIQVEKLSSLGRMAGGLAHEIGNPIGIVQGYLGLLKEGLAGDDERSEFIQRSEQEMQRIGTLLRQLLDLSKPSTTEAESVSLHEVLEGLIQLLKPQPLMDKVRIDSRFHAEVDWVHANRDQLQQVFLNCLMNAADAINSKESITGGDIIISSRLSDGDGLQHLVIEIADNGIGIENGDLDSVFDPFYTTKEPGKGTGLGLSVSYTLVESFGGTIELAGNDNGGVTVTICLPLYSGGEASDNAH